jgi:hypothetical protein
MALEKPDVTGLAHRLFPPGSPQRLELLRAAWPLAVGPDLARRTEVLALEGRTLRVRVPDAGWRKVLHRLCPQILGKLAAVAGDAAPNRLGFQEEAFAMRAGVNPARPPDLPRADTGLAPPPAPPPSVAREAEAITDPELRRAFLEVAGRYLARGAILTEKENA